MSTQIHPTAIVDPKAELADDVVVGPYAIIDGNVSIGSGCVVGPHCRITGWTTIGAGNRFESHCSIGAPPQDLKYAGEPTRLEIGDRNTFREFVTFHRGTPGGGGLTTVGSDGLYMAYVHVAHDCHVGDRTIFANAATLAGHVEVGEHLPPAYTGAEVVELELLGLFQQQLAHLDEFVATAGIRPGPSELVRLRDADAALDDALGRQVPDRLAELASALTNSEDLFWKLRAFAVLNNP